MAVRSSATAEDTEAASFAGMNETFLNVRGPDEVVDAVRRCWSSLFGARTVFYRAKQGFGQADMDIAVVVQIQILSTRAGVMFTIDPASGDRDRLVIEGSLGLGESVVSGQVSPDRYVVDKETLHILKRDVKRKELVIEPLPDGGTRTRELSGDESTQARAQRRGGPQGGEARDPRRGPLRHPAGHRVGLRRGGPRLDAAVPPGDRLRRRQERPSSPSTRARPSSAASAPPRASATAR